VHTAIHQTASRLVNHLYIFIFLSSYTQHIG